MRSTVLLLSLALLGGCAVGPRIVSTERDVVVGVADVAAAVADADVVALGELHQTPEVHATHLALIEELYALRPDMVVAMEMFERDTQTVLLQYLNGLVDEDRFRSEARVWSHYARDYRPVIEFCKARGIHVIAANAPRELAQKAAKEGVDAVLGDDDLARETSAPKDDYWDAFCEMMEGHEGVLGDDGMERYYAAQCLKDDTMAESITDYLRRRAERDSHPLVVFVCGRAHSDYGRGTVQRIRSRMPDLDVRVLSAETVDDPAKFVYESPSNVADYVVVAKQPARARPTAAAVEDPAAPPIAAAEPAAEPAGEPAEEPGNPEGLSPAFGFMPGNYGLEIDGIEVGPVTPGGCAEKAGIEEGDYILAVDGKRTPDIETYMDVLSKLRIGRKVTVRVRREQAEVDLQVEVGSRTSRR